MHFLLLFIHQPVTTVLTQLSPPFTSGDEGGEAFIVKGIQKGPAQLHKFAAMKISLVPELQGSWGKINL